jgi:hypothetical protein
MIKIKPILNVREMEDIVISSIEEQMIQGVNEWRKIALNNNYPDSDPHIRLKQTELFDLNGGGNEYNPLQDSF